MQVGGSLKVERVGVGGGASRGRIFTGWSTLFVAPLAAER